MAGPELMILSAGLQAFQGFQAYQQGKAQSKAATQAADYNARVAQQQSDVEKSKLQRQQRSFQASQRVRGAASGATLESFEDTFEDTKSQSLLDVALLDYDTKVRKQGILFGGQQQSYQARSSGRQGLISGLGGAATSGFKAYGGSGFSSKGSFNSPTKNNIGQNVGTYQRSFR